MLSMSSLRLCVNQPVSSCRTRQVTACVDGVEVRCPWKDAVLPPDSTLSADPDRPVCEEIRSSPQSPAIR